MKRVTYLVLAILVVSSLFAVPASADGGCDMPMDGTVASLLACVNHAISAGFVTGPGVAQSLLAKVQAAQAAVLRGQNQAAIGQLQAFVAQVQALSGIQIDAQHADHMIMHAQMVIAALGG